MPLAAPTEREPGAGRQPTSMDSKILFVDDDPSLLASFQRTLRGQFRLDTASSGPEALQLLRANGPYAVVVCDMRMPGLSGIQVLEQVRLHAPDTVRIMLTGNGDLNTAVEAVNRGEIFRFLNKPCGREVLIPALETALKQNELVRMERDLLENTLTGSVKVLADVLGMVAPAAAERGQRLRDAMRVLGPVVQADPQWQLEIAALLSSIGFASVPPSVLRKLEVNAPLGLEEKQIVQRVPQVGHDLLAGIPRLEGVARMILFQNKHFDGDGFPSEVCSGTDIPLGARLLKILLDRLALEAEGKVGQHAFGLMKARAGVYDPRLLELSFTHLPQPIGGVVEEGDPVLALSIEELTVGQVIAEDIVTPSGLLLVRAGNMLTAPMVERLRNLAELGELREPFMIRKE